MAGKVASSSLPDEGTWLVVLPLDTGWSWPRSPFAVLGAVACVIAARVGIPFKPPNQPVVLVRPIASVSAAALGAAIAMAVAVVGALVPAWLASRNRSRRSVDERRQRVQKPYSA